MMRDNAGSFLASTPSHRKGPRVHFIAKLLTSSWEDYSFFSVHHGVCWRFDASIRRGQATRKCKYGKVYWFHMVGGDFQLSYISYRFKDVEISWYVCESWRFILRFRSVHRQIKVLKNQISELSKANYELEREARMFDQRIGLLINYKKATEVG